MKTITVTCETITPLFLAGADGNTPELRAPSIKGALRFWWRAMNGHLPLEDQEDSKGNLIQTGLKSLEGEIFGNTSERSSFSIHITPFPNESEQKNVEKNQSCDISKENYKGIYYLLYSTLLINKRKCYKSGVEFKFKISFKKKEYYPCIIDSLAGLVLFGALGTRSRRGAGSFRVTGVNLDGFEDREKCYQIFEKNLFQINTVEELIEHYKKIISILPEHNNTSYSVLKGSNIYFFEPEQDWKKALEKIGKPFSEFRGKNKSRISDTPNFGFPVQHRSSCIVMVAGKQGKQKKKPKELLERRASPLLFKIIQTQAGFFPLIICLNGELIPDGFEIMGKQGDNSKGPSKMIIDEFINSLSDIKGEITL